jgi:hypothetical protein
MLSKEVRLTAQEKRPKKYLIPRAGGGKGLLNPNVEYLGATDRICMMKVRAHHA